METRPRFRRALVAVALAAAAGLAATTPAPAGAAAAAPAARSYIVTLAPGAGDPATAARAQLGRHGEPGEGPNRVFRHAIRGYTATLTADEARSLAADPAVAAVEADSAVTAVATQANAPWGLDRIDQRNRPLSSTYTYTSTGSGVSAYVIDTGVRLNHLDLAGRAVSGYDAVDGGPADDCNGHGTHVASTLAGGTYGVAKATRVVAVRVLNCSGNGTVSGVIAGVDWAVSNHVAGQAAVANMSLGGGASSALDAAINRLINDGVTVVVAAGNSSANACSSSPARVPAALTVAASTSSDGFASFSNRGSCVDVIAPGASITAAWWTSTTATNTISGTSMASPHAAGVAARILSRSPGWTPAQVTSSITSTATTNVVTGVPSGTPNRLLYGNPTA